METAIINSQSDGAEAPQKGKEAVHGSQNPFFDPSQEDFYALVFYLLLSAMTIRQDTVLAQSKEIRHGATIQDKINSELGGVHFSVLPANANTQEINKVQDDNEEHAAQRQNLQNSLIILRQTNQVTMTQASTNINLMQENASEDSDFLKKELTIAESINQMIQ